MRRAATNKIGPENWDAWPGSMRGYVTSQLTGSYAVIRPLLEGVVLPNIELFAPLIAVAEVIIGLALLFGIATRLAALIGLLLTTSYFLMKGTAPLAPSNDMAFMVGCVIVMLGRAGRSAGIDKWLARRWPRVPLW